MAFNEGGNYPGHVLLSLEQVLYSDHHTAGRWLFQLASICIIWWAVSASTVV